MMGAIENRVSNASAAPLLPQRSSNHSLTAQRITCINCSPVVLNFFTCINYLHDAKGLERPRNLRGDHVATYRPPAVVAVTPRLALQDCQALLEPHSHHALKPINPSARIIPPAFRR